MKYKENKKLKTRIIIFLIFIAGIVAALFIFNTLNIQNKKSNTYECKNCNVIFLDVDLLRADHIGLLNKEYENTTPNIDKFFRNGIIFKDVTAPVGATQVGNIAILTNTDPFIISNIVQTKYYDLNPESLKKPLITYSNKSEFSNYKNIFQIFKKQNYTTIEINDGGFSGRNTFMDAGTDEYYEETFPEKKINEAFKQTTKKILELEKNSEANTSNKKSFFLLMHSNNLHAMPYRYPNNRTHINNKEIVYLKKLGKDWYNIFFDFDKSHQPLTENKTINPVWLKRNYKKSFHIQWMNESIYQNFHKLSYELYSQQLKFVDEQLGTIFNELENDKNLLNNTIVVLYSNHGDGLLDNKILNHDVSYQSCIHVPILIRYPNMKKSVIIKEPVALLDLTPTIYALLNITNPKNQTDYGLIPVLTGNKYDREYLFGTSGDRFVRKGDMKLIIFGANLKELYNVTSDPKETNNLIKEYPQIAQELNDALEIHQITIAARNNFKVNKLVRTT